jgi:hypothetical protein
MPTLVFLDENMAQPLDWLIGHLSLIGWPAVVAGAWKLSRFLGKLEERAIDAEAHIKIVLNSNQELKDTLDSEIEAQRDLAKGVSQLAVSLHELSELNHAEVGLLRDIMSKNEIMINNQTNMMNNFQRVVEQLVALVSRG